MHFAKVLLATCAVFSTATAFNYTIKVVLDNSTAPQLFKFDPPFINNMTTGDMYKFDFSEVRDGAKHNIWRSKGIQEPCTADMVNGSRDPITTTLSYVVNENMTRQWPIYYICAVSNHCKGGMVFGMNLGPSPNEAYNAFKEKAALTPWKPTEGSLVSGVKMSKMTGLTGVPVVLLVGLLL